MQETIEVLGFTLLVLLLIGFVLFLVIPLVVDWTLWAAGKMARLVSQLQGVSGRTEGNACI